jgi:hypothetical protein
LVKKKVAQPAAFDIFGKGKGKEINTGGTSKELVNFY